MHRHNTGAAIMIAVAGVTLSLWNYLGFSLALAKPEAFSQTGFSSLEAIETDAERELASGHTDEALAAARAAYRLTPIADGALAIAARAFPPGPQRARAIAVGLRLTRHDALLNLAKLEQSAQVGDVTGMVVDADYLLRSEPALGATIGPALIKESRNPEFASAFARDLATRPPWRTRFLQSIGRNPADGKEVLDLLMRLKRLKAPADESELAPFFALGGRSLPPRDLRAAWIAIDSGVDKGAAARPVYDDRFSGLSGVRPFNWMLYASPNADVRITNGLEVRGEGGATLPVAVEEIILATGRHRIAAMAATIDDAAFGRLTIDLECLDGRALGSTTSKVGNSSTVISLDVYVPPDCPAERLYLISDPEFGQDRNVFRVSRLTVD